MLPEFYEDCEIFITGGSGVVGKAAIEKLLRSSDVRRIYVLLRAIKDQSVEQRFEKIKCSKIFRVLKTQKPAELNKLVAIPGDAVLPQLGITPDYAKILENVSIFFHCAATVRFNESLKVAMKLNVGGTWEALKFAQTLKKLKIYVHVSTFFSNPYLECVESKLYPSPVDWKLWLEMLQDDKQQILYDALTKKIIVGFPNTYCFTKNLAESVVKEFCHRLPVAIYRPSIVVSSAFEPEPGFPPSLVGAMGLFVLVGAGLLKVVQIKPGTRLDMTPLDIGTNIMLTSAYMAAEKYKAGTVVDVPVTLASSYGILKQTFQQLGEIPQNNGFWNELVFNKSFLIPHCYFSSNRFIYITMAFLYQILPCMMVDGLLRMFGRKPVLMGVVRKYFVSLEVMQPFLSNNYSSDFVHMLKDIVDVTKNTNFDMEDSVNLFLSDEGLTQYIKSMVQAIRGVLLNEDPLTLPRARKVLAVKTMLYNLCRGLLAFYILRWFYRILLNYVNN